VESDAEPIPSGQGEIPEFATFPYSLSSVHLDEDGSFFPEQRLPTSYEHPDTQADSIEPAVLPKSQGLDNHETCIDNTIEGNPDDDAIIGSEKAAMLTDFGKRPQDDTTSPESPITIHHLNRQQWQEIAYTPLRERLEKIAHKKIRGDDQTSSKASDSIAFASQPAQPTWGHWNVSGQVRPDDIYDPPQTQSRVHADLKTSSSHFTRSASRSSPELDMTSAVRFARSKALVEQDDTPKRRGIKRKADEIAELISQEERAWDPPSPFATKLPSIDKSLTQDNSTSQPRQESQPEITSNHGTSGHRTKRLKKFAEAVGYAALGGVAVGASLFSLLVATAPEFV